MKDLPKIPEDALHVALRKPLARVREELQRIMGTRGDDRDRAVRLGELIDAGIVSIARSNTGPGVRPGPGVGGGGGGEEPYVPDLTPPPTPTGLTVTAGISFLLIECDPEIYTQGRGHAETIVYGAQWPLGEPTPPTFANAVRITSASAAPIAYATNPNTRWCIWMKWKSRDGVESTSPAGGTNGVQATTGQDVTQLLEVLTGQITESQLFSALGDRIDLIDGPDTLVGSVNARLADQLAVTNTLILDEQTARSNADAAEASARNALAAQLRGSYTGNDIDAITTGLLYQERVARVTQDDALAQQITLLSAGVGEQFDHLRIWYFDSGVESWTGNGTPTAVNGWLRPASQASNPHVISPVSLAVGATTYPQVKARIRKVGTPTWEGKLYWQRTTDSTWDEARASTETEPSYDVNGIALLSFSPAWDGTINRIRLDLSTSSDGSNYFEIDWVAIGRPAPGASAAALAQEQIARANADSALASDITTVNARLNTGGDTFQSIVNVQNTATSAQNTATTAASQITTLQSAITRSPAVLGDFAAGLTYWTNSRGGSPDTVGTAAGTIIDNDPDFGRCAQISNLSAVGNNIGLKSVLAVAPGRTYRMIVRFKVHTLPSDGSVQINAMWAWLDDAYGNINSSFGPSTTISTAGQVVSIEYLISDVVATGVAAWGAGTKYLRPLLRLNTAETGLVLRVQSLRVEDVTDARSNAAAIQQEITTRASETGALQAQYTVKVDVNGYVSGFGLASTANNAAPFSEFAIRADRFYVASPSGPGIAPIVPFVVNTTTQTVNGVSVPPGVYMDAAFIKNGTIIGAKIANLTVDNAKLISVSAAKLTAGSIAVGQFIQSTGYVSGSSGWRINGNGSAEFSGVIVRGTIIATAGSIGGNTIDATGMQSSTYTANVAGWRLNSNGTGQIGGFVVGTDHIRSTNYSAGSAGWRLDRAGNFEANNGTFRGGGTFSGALQAATGTFAGSLSAATGTFSGSLTAAAVNAVNTINLAGEAVTVPRSAYTAGSIALSSTTAWTTIASVAVPAVAGQNQFIVFSANLFSNSVNQGIEWRLVRGSTVFLSGVAGLPSLGINSEGILSASPGGAQVVSGCAADNPGSGAHTYELQARSQGITGSSATQRSIIAIGTKR